MLDAGSKNVELRISGGGLCRSSGGAGLGGSETGGSEADGCGAEDGQSEKARDAVTGWEGTQMDEGHARGRRVDRNRYSALI